jgi:hypothetical protein
MKSIGSLPEPMLWAVPTLQRFTTVVCDKTVPTLQRFTLNSVLPRASKKEFEGDDKAAKINERDSNRT